MGWVTVHVLVRSSIVFLWRNALVALGRTNAILWMQLLCMCMYRLVSAVGMWVVHLWASAVGDGRLLLSSMWTLFFLFIEEVNIVGGVGHEINRGFSWFSMLSDTHITWTSPHPIFDAAIPGPFRYPAIAMMHFHIWIRVFAALYTSVGSDCAKTVLLVWVPLKPSNVKISLAGLRTQHACFTDVLLCFLWTKALYTIFLDSLLRLCWDFTFPFLHGAGPGHNLEDQRAKWPINVFLWSMDLRCLNSVGMLWRCNFNASFEGTFFFFFLFFPFCVCVFYCIW